MAEKKTYFENDSVALMPVPHIPGLMIRDLLKLLPRFPKAEKYLPDEDDRAKLPKRYLASILASVDPDLFKRIVTEKRAKHREEI